MLNFIMCIGFDLRKFKFIGCPSAKCSSPRLMVDLVVGSLALLMKVNHCMTKNTRLLAPKGKF